MTRLVGDLQGFFHLPINTERNSTAWTVNTVCKTLAHTCTHAHMQVPTYTNITRLSSTEPVTSRLIKIVIVAGKMTFYPNISP